MKTIIANNNVVKKIAPREGKTVQIGSARLTWKVSLSKEFYENQNRRLGTGTHLFVR